MPVVKKWLGRTVFRQVPVPFWLVAVALSIVICGIVIRAPRINLVYFASLTVVAAIVLALIAKLSREVRKPSDPLQRRAVPRKKAQRMLRAYDLWLVVTVAATVIFTILDTFGVPTP